MKTTITGIRRRHTFEELIRLRRMAVMIQKSLGNVLTEKGKANFSDGNCGECNHQFKLEDIVNLATTQPKSVLILCDTCTEDLYEGDNPE